MLNIKKALTKMGERLNITTVDYTVTTGTTLYFGVYYANITLTKPNPSMFYVYNVESNRPTYVQRIDNNTIRVNSITAEAVVTVRCIYIHGVGGVISYLIHLTESLKSFGGRRWARYAEPQEAAYKDARRAECSKNACAGNHNVLKRYDISHFLFPLGRHNAVCNSVKRRCGNDASYIVDDHRHTEQYQAAGRSLCATDNFWRSGSNVENSHDRECIAFGKYKHSNVATVERHRDLQIGVLIPREGVMAC